MLRTVFDCVCVFKSACVSVSVGVLFCAFQCLIDCVCVCVLYIRVNIFVRLHHGLILDPTHLFT